MEYVTKTVDLGGRGSYKQVRTDHSEEIVAARARADRANSILERTEILAACALLECHDATGISLDDWLPVREFVESTLGFVILENHV
jgi:hypothetical protein